MFNIEDIEETLYRWAAWQRRTGDSLGIKPLALYNDGKARGNVRYFPMSDEEGARFDPAVAVLSQIDKELGEWVRQHYIYGATYRDISKATGINVSQIHAAINSAKYFIVGFLNGHMFCEAQQVVKAFAFQTKSV